MMIYYITPYYSIVSSHPIRLPVMGMIGECPGCDGKDVELPHCNGESWGAAKLQWGKLGNCHAATGKVGELSCSNGENWGTSYSNGKSTPSFPVAVWQFPHFHCCSMAVPQLSPLQFSSSPTFTVAVWQFHIFPITARTFPNHSHHFKKPFYAPCALSLSPSMHPLPLLIIWLLDWVPEQICRHTPWLILFPLPSPTYPPLPEGNDF